MNELKPQEETKKDALIILSGGMDSVTLLHKLVAEGKRVMAISFNYGQKHERELILARDNCQRLGIKHNVYTFPASSKSALTSEQNVPHGHYSEETMRQTIVPNRNMIMLSIAAGIAEGLKIPEVYYAAHNGDHAIYWDCREDFVAQLNATLALNDNFPVKIVAPFLGIDKGDIAAIGTAIGVDYGLTHTCYEGKPTPCGRCGACVERAEAFLKANATDPLVN